MLAIILTVSLGIYVARLPLLAKQSAAPFHFISRESSLLINSGLLMIAMLTILLGTLYPLVIDAMHLDAISVGAPYFNMVMAPLVLVLLAFMGIGPLCQWQQQDPRLLMFTLVRQLAVSLTASLVLLFTIADTLQPSAVISLALSIWVIVSVLGSFRVKPG